MSRPCGTPIETEDGYRCPCGASVVQVRDGELPLSIYRCTRTGVRYGYGYHGEEWRPTWARIETEVGA